MCATSLPSPTSDSPTMNAAAMTRPPMVVGVPEKSGKGPATLTSGAERGQAGAQRSSAHAACGDRSYRRGRRRCRPAGLRAGGQRREAGQHHAAATTSTTRPTRTCCAARSRSAPSWRARASAAWATRSWRSCRRRAARRRRTRTSGSRCCSLRWRRRRSPAGRCASGSAATLGALDVADARAAYAAIRARRRRRAATSASSTTCAPSRRSACARRWRAPPERDSIASEYVSDFALTFETGVPALAAALGDGLGVREAIVELHLRLLAARARHADRAQARRRARRRGCRRARATCSPPEACAPRRGGGRCGSFDASLREPGNALNPGTTADLVTATLFVALLEGML